MVTTSNPSDYRTFKTILHKMGLNQGYIFSDPKFVQWWGTFKTQFPDEKEDYEEIRNNGTLTIKRIRKEQ